MHDRPRSGERGCGNCSRLVETGKSDSTAGAIPDPRNFFRLRNWADFADKADGSESIMLVWGAGRQHADGHFSRCARSVISIRPIGNATYLVDHSLLLHRRL